MKRCRWVNLDNRLYVDYHDREWGKPKYDDKELFELLILEMFQAGLSWECVLNKRDSFRKCFDNFDYEKISKYDVNKVNELMNNKDIIRNKLKIKASINNSKVFIDIRSEFGSFSNYIWGFTNNKILYNCMVAYNDLSDRISNDLKKRGMKFVGSIIIYSYLQAIGVINDHEDGCFLHKEEL